MWALCGGIEAAIDNTERGLINNWLLHVRDILFKHSSIFRELAPQERANRLCEINCIEQVYNLGHSTIIQSAWRRKQNVIIYGWVYGIQNGRLNLDVTANSREQLEVTYRQAIAKFRLSQQQK